MKKTIFAIAPSIIPLTAYGQLAEIRNVNSLATRLAGIGNIITYLLVGLAVIYIIWNTVHYFIRPSGSDRSEAGMSIMWGIIGLFIIVSLWGIVNILVNTFYTNPNVPKDRFPNANFVSGDRSNVGGGNFTGSDDFSPGSGFDIRDNPAGDSGTSGDKSNNWNTGLNPNSTDNTQNYNH